MLTAGAHEYSFQFRLPDSLSSSFESQDVCKGRVHYLLRARLDSPDEHVRQTRDKTLIILSSLDLNKEHRVAVSYILIIIIFLLQIFRFLWSSRLYTVNVDMFAQLNFRASSSSSHIHVFKFTSHIILYVLLWS